MMELEILLTESAMAEEFHRALERRYLPEKFFYWLPLSVKAWLDLCDESRPYKNYSRSYQLISKYSSDVAKLMSGAKVAVVSLGAGQGDKDLILLKALRARGVGVSYWPVDSSQALLEIALARASRAGFQSRGVKADVEVLQSFAKLAALPREPRLYLLLGNTLGVIDPIAFLKGLKKLLRPKDRLLVDAEIFNPRTTLAGYDNPINRKFAFAPLASIGVREGRDGELVFEAKNSRLKGLYSVGKYFRAARALKIPVAGQVVEFRVGEKLLMNASPKYSTGVFQKLLRSAGGFQPLREYVSDDEQFLMLLAAPARR